MPGAVAAASALDWINIARMFGEGDGKISRITFNGFNFTVCYQIDIRMPADLDQFG
jgi:hypothetical protein